MLPLIIAPLQPVSLSFSRSNECFGMLNAGKENEVTVQINSTQHSKPLMLKPPVIVVNVGVRIQLL